MIYTELVSIAIITIYPRHPEIYIIRGIDNELIMIVSNVDILAYMRSEVDLTHAMQPWKGSPTCCDELF